MKHPTGLFKSSSFPLTDGVDGYDGVSGRNVDVDSEFRPEFPLQKYRRSGELVWSCNFEVLCRRITHYHARKNLKILIRWWSAKSEVSSKVFGKLQIQFIVQIMAQIDPNWGTIWQPSNDEQHTRNSLLILKFSMCISTKIANFSLFICNSVRRIHFKLI